MKFMRIAGVVSVLFCLPEFADAASDDKPNPFAGTSAAFEQKLRLLEEKKLDAAIANEELAAEKALQEKARMRSGLEAARGAEVSHSQALARTSVAQRAASTLPVSNEAIAPAIPTPQRPLRLV